MTLNDIKKTIKKIKKEQSDDEYAHDLEDDLFETFIRHVADVAEGELREMAKTVLESKKINFARWTA